MYKHNTVIFYYQILIINLYYYNIIRHKMYCFQSVNTTANKTIAVKELSCF